MVYGWAESVAKRPGYPSGKWHPEAELSQGLRGKLIYVWHQGRVRVWVLLLMLVGLLIACLASHWVSAGTVISEGIFLAGVAGVLYLSLRELLRGGVAVEGLVSGVSDDGIDRMYTIYCEAAPDAYEIQFTAKCRSPAGKLQPGDSITLILGPPRALGPRKVILFPPTAKVSPPR